MPEDVQIEVIVEYDQFIAGRELSEIIEILDEAFWYEIEDEFIFPPFRYRYPFRAYQEPAPSIFCISEINKGSLLLTGFIGGAAAKYCYDRFKKGLRRSRLGDEIEHLGHMAGDSLARIIDRMNLWLEEYTADAKEKRSRIKSIKVRRKKG